MEIYLLVGSERLGFDVITEFHRHVVVFECSEDLVDLANLLLVFQEDRGVEVGNVVKGALAHQVVLTGVCEESQFFDLK